VLEAMAKKKKDKPWHLKVTWTLSIVMLLLITGFFIQSFQEMLKIEPVQVAIEQITTRETTQDPEPE
jgi:hypothetical protein